MVTPRWWLAAIGCGSADDASGPPTRGNVGGTCPDVTNAMFYGTPCDAADPANTSMICGVLDPAATKTAGKPAYSARDVGCEAILVGGTAMNCVAVCP